MVQENVLPKSYTENVSRFSAEELEPYEGKYVAFSSDGARILAHADSYLDLVKKLDDMRLAPTEYEIEPIPPSDSALMM
jgi:hypothetical protein